MSETSMRDTILCLAEKLAACDAEKASIEKERDMYRDLWISASERVHSDDGDEKSCSVPAV